MVSNHPVSEDHLLFFDEQQVTVVDFDATGYILDIGGGGEGIIGKLKGEQVVAIDVNRRELEEAAEGPLKIIMDARDLQFLDDTFSVATAFFSLMYLQGADHKKVFGEVFRVLKGGGRFFIWDVTLPQRLDEEKDIAVFPLLVKLPNEEVRTGYGARWPEEEQGLAYYVKLAEDAGFDVVAQEERRRTFFLEPRKP